MLNAKSINEIVNEVTAELSNSLTDDLTKIQVENILSEILIDAFTHAPESTAQQKLLYRALSLKLHPDRYKNFILKKHQLEHKPQQILNEKYEPMKTFNDSKITRFGFSESIYRLWDMFDNYPRPINVIAKLAGLGVIFSTLVVIALVFVTLGFAGLITTAPLPKMIKLTNFLTGGKLTQICNQDRNSNSITWLTVEAIFSSIAEPMPAINKTRAILKRVILLGAAFPITSLTAVASGLNYLAKELAIYAALSSLIFTFGAVCTGALALYSIAIPLYLKDYLLSSSGDNVHNKTESWQHDPVRRADKSRGIVYQSICAAPTNRDVDSTSHYLLPDDNDLAISLVK
jgi:hypothetical protein